MAEVKRSQYLDSIWEYKDQDVIKILSGIRRCGKSTIMMQFIDMLKESGVSEDFITYKDMESLSNERFRDGMVLYEHIMSMDRTRRRYVLIDEVQNIDGWERVVNSLKKDIDCDIYLTGSNAYMLSSDISTLLTGRSHTFRILPLSLHETCELGLANDPREGYHRYVVYGGLPFMRPDMHDSIIRQRIEDIKSDIILKDICNRKNRIDSNKVRKVIRYMYSEIGNSISVDNVAKKLSISTSTASEYLQLIVDSMLFMKAERFDIKGKVILTTDPKYYCTDMGMRNTQPLPEGRDRGRVMENIVYLELIRRGYEVYVGKVDSNLEVDFIARKGDRTDYYQVTESLRDVKTNEREYRSLRALTARGERYIITGDGVPKTANDDAIVMDIVDFLMGDDEFKDVGFGKGRLQAYQQLSRELERYIRICSKIFATKITRQDFDELSVMMQTAFFDLQSDFRSPYLIEEGKLQGWLIDIRKDNLRLHRKMIECVNVNEMPMYTPNDEGEMERLTDMQEELNRMIKRMQ
ncbi:MAG: ATP-binding protein [Thermoplasmata archaeon]|nr:ATP-binding protein [Thermoplasmata archaeon]